MGDNPRGARVARPAWFGHGSSSGQHLHGRRAAMEAGLETRAPNGINMGPIGPIGYAPGLSRRPHASAGGLAPWPKDLPERRPPLPHVVRRLGRHRLLAVTHGDEQLGHPAQDRVGGR